MMERRQFFDKTALCSGQDERGRRQGARSFAGLCSLAFVLMFVVSSFTFAQQGAPDQQWPTYGGDHGSTKYAPLDQISRETVADLEVVWRWESPDNAIVTANRTTLPTIPSAFKATPVLVDGVLYTFTPGNLALALNAETGAECGPGCGSWCEWCRAGSHCSESTGVS